MILAPSEYGGMMAGRAIIHDALNTVGAALFP